MRLFLSLLVLSMSHFTQAQAPAEKEWKAWVQEQNEKAKTDPKSYLNVNDAAYVKSGQTVYLKKDFSKWSETPIKDYAAKVHFTGTEALIDRPNMKPSDILKEHQWQANPDILISAYFQEDLLRLFIHNRKNPNAVNFKGFKFYPYNPAMVITGVFKRIEPFEKVTFATERHLQKSMSLFGRIDFKVGNEDNWLNLYGGTEPEKFFFVWFRDKTSGHGSYGAARSLDLKLKDVPADGEKIVLDFNRLTNPNCARSTFYNCLVTRDPALKSAITAGEMDPGEHH